MRLQAKPSMLAPQSGTRLEHGDHEREHGDHEREHEGPEPETEDGDRAPAAAERECISPPALGVLAVSPWGAQHWFYGTGSGAGGCGA